MRLLAAAGLALVLASTALAAGGTRNVDLLRSFRTQLPKVKHATAVPVLLPHYLPLGGTSKLYTTQTASRRSFELSLAGAPNCLGANACFVATFDGTRGGKLPGRPNVRLASGDPAIYRAFSCGGSCSPTSFWFTHGGVLYSWQVKDLPKGERTILTRMANEAIAAGPR